MILQPGNYITRSGQLIYLTDEIIESGAVKLVSAGPMNYEYEISDEESGMPVQMQLGEGEFILSNSEDNALVFCRLYTGEISMFTSEKVGSDNLAEAGGSEPFLEYINRRSSTVN